MSAQQSMKDKAMAAFLRDHGVRRTTGLCPVCHRMIGLGAAVLFAHFATGCHSRRPADRRHLAAVR